MNHYYPPGLRSILFTPQISIALLLTLGLATNSCQNNTETPAQPVVSTTSPSTSGSEIAVVRGLTMGDRACYMKLEDAQGQNSEEEASFELCDQEQLVGQQVQLTRVLTPILAMSCQGDPECTQRDTVDLIVQIVPVGRQDNASASLVSQLYERFPAPSEDTSLSEDEVFINQNREVLTQFFNSELTDLILADRDCVAQRGEVCRLDFDPIWNSQDPTGYTIEVHSTEQPEIVEVQVQAPGSLERTELEYRLVKEDNEWRIADISYPEGFTLHELLDTFPPE